MKKVIVFDMDDTLYDEYTYVKSGFYAVAAFLTEVLNESRTKLYEQMWTHVQTHGRGSVFDDLLKSYGMYSKKLARQCISVYRLHEPNIELPAETLECLRNLSGFPLYLVTDGNKNAQHQKVLALGLYDIMKKCYITHRFGVHNAKPSVYCFEKIMSAEDVQPEQMVYIGDNPRKDFVGIKPLGVRTIRILIGQHRDVIMPKEYEAEINISCLNELPEALQKIWPDAEF